VNETLTECRNSSFSLIYRRIFNCICCVALDGGMTVGRELDRMWKEMGAKKFKILYQRGTQLDVLVAQLCATSPFLPSVPSVK
jgi:hypothetical protein